MVNFVNYGDVLGQLRAGGLLPDEPLLIGMTHGGRLPRCRIEGKEREKRGWYLLHELHLDGGDIALVGSFGIWRGASNNATKIELRLDGKARKLTPEQSAAIKARAKADQKRADDERARESNRAADRATAAWRKCSSDGTSAYLQRKGVGAHGVRFSPQGNLVIPMLDIGQRIRGLQVIYAKAKRRHDGSSGDKDYWPKGLAKQGSFFHIGPVPGPGSIILIGEGYATCASAFEATGYPAFVAWDAGNLAAVTAALHKRYPKARIIILADDDYLGKCDACSAWTTVATPTCTHCGAEHKKENAGHRFAPLAALAVEGAWLAPTFAADRPLDKKGPTDWNDLHAVEGLHAVRAQLEGYVRRLAWDQAPQPPRSTPGGRGADDGAGQGGEQQLDPAKCHLVPIESMDELLERFSLVYELPEVVFDAQEHILVPLASMRNACTSRATHRQWMEDGRKRIVRKREVDFDPSEQRTDILCNLWGGWPTAPAEGDCESLLELLYMLCSQDPNADALYQWVLRWLAYPLQHPGAKLKTALVVHGPQGTGKNLFFEAVKAIYGHYGGVVDQAAIEDKFNDYASRKLFIVADEVVARAELFHIANRLKSLVTGDTIRINPKNLGAYEETNHLQVVFLSNGVMPIVVEPDDRRYCVIWTPAKQDPAYYARVRDEIARGGIAALHHHLLHLPLTYTAGGKQVTYEPGTLPPITEAKKDLIELSLDSTERFWNDWVAERLPLPVITCRSEDLYDAYRHWCTRNGVGKAAQLSTFVGATAKRPGAHKDRVRHESLDNTAKLQQSMVIWPPGRVHTEQDLEARSEDIRRFYGAVGRYRNSVERRDQVAA